MSRSAWMVIAIVAVSLSGCGANVVGAQGPNSDIASRGAAPFHHTFKYTGGEQAFKVPNGVTWITVVAHGAAGDGGTYLQRASLRILRSRRPRLRHYSGKIRRNATRLRRRTR